MREPTKLQTPCKVWIGPMRGNGYGCWRVGGKPFYAHRRAWELAHGPIPRGMSVLHRCDNPPCCEVTHLFLGTALDNSRDMWAKGRGFVPPATPGVLNPKVKLTAAQVAEIRAAMDAAKRDGHQRRRRGDRTAENLATRFGISRVTVHMIARRFTWAP
jgi:HNH endonuclease